MDYNKIIIILSIILIVVVITVVLVLNPINAKTETVLTVTSNSTLYEGDSFSVSLTDVNGTPISNQTVNITFIDENGVKNPRVVTTDSEGNAILQLNELTVGDYTVQVLFEGNDNYTGCNTTQNLTLKEKVQPQTHSSGSNELHYDAELNLYYDGNGRIVDPDGQHPMAVGQSYQHVVSLGPPI